MYQWKATDELRITNNIIHIFINIQTAAHTYMQLLSTATSTKGQYGAKYFVEGRNLAFFRSDALSPLTQSLNDRSD